MWNNCKIVFNVNVILVRVKIPVVLGYCKFNVTEQNSKFSDQVYYTVSYATPIHSAIPLKTIFLLSTF